MKNLLLIGLVVFGTAMAAEQIEVTRVTDNVYKTNDHRIIITQYCYEYAIGENAIITDDEEYLIFVDNAEKCDIKKIIR